MDENKATDTRAEIHYLDRNEILSKTKLRTETVDVPEWGGSVMIRELTGTERDFYEGELVDMKAGEDPVMSMENARATLVCLSAVDPTGARLFTEEDIERLGELSAAALDRVFDRAAKLSGITDKDLKELSGN